MRISDQVINFFNRHPGLVAADLFAHFTEYDKEKLGYCTFETADPVDCNFLKFGLLSDEKKPGEYATYKRGAYRSIYIRTGNIGGKPTLVRLKRMRPEVDPDHSTRNRGIIQDKCGIDSLEKGHVVLKRNGSTPIMRLMPVIY